MSETLKIKLSIADRVYPLNIDPSQEEGLRKASKKIDDLLKKFEQSYAVRDKQDVLAMCALQFASEQEIQKIEDSEEHKQALVRLEKLEEKLSKLLK